MTRKNSPKSKEAEIADRTAPPGDVVYQAIHDEGEHELTRSSGALALSGLAAGLSMGLSLIAETLLRTHLPQATWAPLISKLGYSVGFIIVILGRQQLFTKNTLTVILPLLKNRRLSVFGNVARLWSLVLGANLAGSAFFACLLARTGVFEPDIHAVIEAVSREATTGGSFGIVLLRAILSGWIIALMVWLLPFAEAARLWVIVILAYLDGLAGFPHIIAGSVESFYLVASGQIPLLECLRGFILPTMLGNVIGGVALVAAGAHAEFTAAGKDR